MVSARSESARADLIETRSAEPLTHGPPVSFRDWRCVQVSSRDPFSASASQGEAIAMLVHAPNTPSRFRQQAMTMGLRRRDKHHVMKAITGVPGTAMRQELARANGDCGVDKVNSVTERRDEAVEPISQSADMRLAGSTELVRWQPRSRRVRPSREKRAHDACPARVEAPTFVTKARESRTRSID